MINSKLILVEGLPGSGKSTTATIMNDMLKQQNVDTKLFLEGNAEHPADYEGGSYFSKTEFDKLLEQYKEVQSILVKHAIVRCDGFVLPQYKLKEELDDSMVPNSFWDDIWNHDIYELPLEKNIELITDKWKRFVEQAMTGNQTYIFECCFIQNPVTIGMIKYGASQEVVMNYVKQLAEIIEPLNPVLIYVDQQDLSHSFKKAVQERPKEWSTGFMDYYNNQGYGKILSAQGIEGTISVLEARKQVESSIFNALAIKKFKIDNTQFEIDSYKNRIMEIFMNTVKM
jgi:energy-coupling factor transporter ATP-binding protein EcfA2